MASYPPSEQAQWRIAIRYLTFGVGAAAVLLSMWWIGRLADHVETYRSLLVSIQRDVLVITSKLDSMQAISTENARRLVTVEDRTTRSAEDRQHLQETDQQVIEGMMQLRGALDQLRKNLDIDLPDPGPKSRPRLQQ